MENIKKALKKETVQVKVKKCFEPETNNFGKTQMNCIVQHNGDEYYATIPEKKIEQVKAGVQLLGIRKNYNGNFYYEWAMAEDMPKPEDMPVPMGDNRKIDVDWDEIAQGKVRHGVAVAYITNGKPLNDITKEEINLWTQFIMNGK